MERSALRPTSTRRESRRRSTRTDRFCASHRDRDEYVRTVARRLHLGRTHCLVCALGASAGLIGSYLASGHLPDGTFGVGYHTGIALLDFLAGDTLRWLVRAPLILLRPLTKTSPLRVVMHAPAWTPAIREMGQLAAETTVRAAVGFFLFGLPLVWAAVSAKSAEGGSHPTHSEWISLLSIAPLVISALTVAYLTFVPQRWLSTIIERERNRVLDELASTLPEQGPDKLLTDVQTKTMALYDAVGGASTATAEGRVIPRRALLVVGALLPQLYVLSLKLLGVSPPT
jgi:hypothetical protein